jgi:hypothetical protein
LPEEDPETVKRILEFLYTHTYSTGDGDQDSDDEPGTDKMGVWFVWDEDRLSRNQRRKLQEGLYEINEEAMQDLLRLLQTFYPSIEVPPTELRH